jgi:hypothetical protein
MNGVAMKPRVRKLGGTWVTEFGDQGCCSLTWKEAMIASVRDSGMRDVYRIVFSKHELMDLLCPHG